MATVLVGSKSVLETHLVALLVAAGHEVTMSSSSPHARDRTRQWQ